MAFNIDMSPLERSGMNVSRGLQGLGQTIGNYQQNQQQQADKQRELMTVDAIEQMHLAPADQQDGIFAQLVNDERFDIDEEDRPYFMDTNAKRAAVAQVKGQEYADNFFGKDEGLSDNPSAVKETEWFNKQTPEVQETHLKIKRGEKPSLDEKLDYEKSKSEIQEDSSIRTARKKTQQQRQQGYIDSGVDSADNLQAVNRSIELLDSIKTGGIDNALIRAKQTLGIESADEAELSYELGKSVLKQLKPTFGAAFTVNEMLELKKMESGLGKSVAGNRRILKNLAKVIKRSAERGMRAAKNLGDDFAAGEIMMAMSGGKPEVKAKTTDNLSDEDLLNQYGGGQ